MTTTTQQPAPIPTREEALDALVERIVAKWGEGERAAGRAKYAGESHGLLLNALAHLYLDTPDAALVAAAKRIMTPTDRRALRKGG